MSILDGREEGAAAGGGSVVPDEDLRYAAQIRAAGVLVDLLVMGGELALPWMSWSVGIRGTVFGCAVGLNDRETQASFEAWVKVLGAQRLADDSSLPDTVVLRARVEEFRGCLVRLSAHLHVPSGGESR